MVNISPNVKFLAQQLRNTGRSISVPRTTKPEFLEQMLALGLIRRDPAADDDETRADHLYVVTEYGQDVVWGRYFATRPGAQISFVFGFHGGEYEAVPTPEQKQLAIDIFTASNGDGIIKSNDMMRLFPVQPYIHCTSSLYGALLAAGIAVRPID